MREIREPRSLVESPTAIDRALEKLLWEAALDPDLLRRLVIRRLTRQVRYWRGASSVAASLYKSIGRPEELMEAMRDITPTCRLDVTAPVPPAVPQRAVGHRLTSGSSGTPLKYFVCRQWRRVHHATWRLAYRHMTSGQLQGYLDPNHQWAMARAPGGSVDNFPHTLECVPSPSGIRFSKVPESVCPFVVHGSVTTILELLESGRTDSWFPRFVICTYESVYDWQTRLIRSAWPAAEIHMEYAANDGGGSAFTCSYGRLHFWTPRALVAENDGNLRVTDLWNSASCFMNYECGDDVKWIRSPCRCGLALPTLSLRGRTSGAIELESGRSIPVMCPFTSSELEGVRAVRVLILPGDRATIEFVGLIGQWQRRLMQKRLEAYGIRGIGFHEVRDFSQLRAANKKYQTVVDARTGKQSHNQPESGSSDHNVLGI